MAARGGGLLSAGSAAPVTPMCYAERDRMSE